MERKNEPNSTDEIEITAEMIDAGFCVIEDLFGVLDRATIAKEVYIAMVRAKARRVFAPNLPAGLGS